MHGGDTTAASVDRLMWDLPLADPGIPEIRSPGRFLLWCARGQTRTLVTGSVFGIVWMGAQAVIPLALGEGLTAVIRRDRGAIVAWAGVVLVLGLVQAAAGILRHRRAVANFLICATRLQQLIVRRATALGGDLARRVATGEVANLGASDIERVGDALDVIARFMGGVASYLLVAGVLLALSPPLGAVVVLGVPVAVLAVAPVLRPFERRQSAEREARTQASSVAADTVAGLRVLRGLGGERVFAARYDRASRAVADASMRTASLQAGLDGAQVLLPGAIVVGVTFLGAHLALRGQLSPGELVAFYASAAFLVIPMQTFVEAAGKWTAAVVAARRILAVLGLEREIADPGAGGPPVPVLDGPLVDRRTGAEILPRQFTVVVPCAPEHGTALVDRIGRWVADDDAAAGVVTIGGREISAMPLEQWRDRVVVLERSPFHLRCRLAEVVGDGTGTGPAAAALEAAQAAEIVAGLPEGIETELPEGWRSLSGGQRQRLGLAQVLARSPEVLLLDDPTSAVDAHTEAAIARLLARLRQGLTTVVVTTSPLMAERADRVVLLAERVVATGTHAELLASEPAYEAIVVRGVAP